MKDINSATKVTAIDASDQILLSDGGTALAKIDYNVLAKAIIEQYTGSSVAGKAQSLKAALDTLNSKLAVVTYSSVEDLYNYGIASPGFKLAIITGTVASSLTKGVIASASRAFLFKADSNIVDALLFSLASGKIYLSRITNGVATKAYTANVTEISLS